MEMCRCIYQAFGILELVIYPNGILPLGNPFKNKPTSGPDDQGSTRTVLAFGLGYGFTV